MAANTEVNKKKIMAIMELLSSSDGSSEEEDDIACILKFVQPSKKPKIMNYIDDIVHQYSECELRKNFRVSRETAYSLCEEFGKSRFSPKAGCGMKPVSSENHILSFLWFAGNKSCLRDVASRFGVGESTLHRNCIRVIDFLLDIAPHITTFPKTQEEKLKAVQDFQEVSGFPGVLGCVDGSYIRIRTPVHKIKSTYVNRHDQTSITLQGICSANKEFIDVFVGASSKIHGSRVFKLSFISKELPTLCSGDWYVLGDAAYPLREWLLTPYRDYGNLTEEQKIFNKKHSSCRVAIENTFGILKQHFCQLMGLDFWTVDKATKFIMSCCVLHNLCIRKNYEWDITEELATIQENVFAAEERGEVQLRRAGQLKREQLCANLQD